MAKIKFVRKYASYGKTMYDIIYQSGRCNAYVYETDLPQTVKDYIINAVMAGKVIHQEDRYHGPETIFEYRKLYT